MRTRERHRRLVTAPGLAATRLTLQIPQWHAVQPQFPGAFGNYRILAVIAGFGSSREPPQI